MLAPVRISLKARWSLNPGHGIARFCYGLCALSRVSLHGPGILETDRLYPSRAFDTTIWAKNSVYGVSPSTGLRNAFAQLADRVFTAATQYLEPACLLRDTRGRKGSLNL